MSTRDSYSIVMRTFWPISPVVGEGMMRVAEELSCSSSTSVITQNQGDIKSSLRSQNRGGNTKFLPVKALSTSSSGMLMRIIDALWFALVSFFLLAMRRPAVVYVATDPPILVPFVVMVYAKIFSAKYVYHVQDIHPEATAIVISLPQWLVGLLRIVDHLIVKNASVVITLTPEMEQSIRARGELSVDKIKLICNPSADLDKLQSKNRYDFSFVGNAGRLQRIPLLIDAVEEHLEKGGGGRFAFAGSGVMQPQLKELSCRFPDHVYYPGKISVNKAAQITLDSVWAMLPIDDEVCRYAFPSKAATYAISGTKILAICGGDTSVAKWVGYYDLGEIVAPDQQLLTNFFDSNVRKETIGGFQEACLGVEDLRELLSTDSFVKNVKSILTAT